MRNKIIYVAGAYSPFVDEYHFRRGIDDNIEDAEKMSIRLWEMGFTVICPHLNTAHFEQDCTCKYQDYIEGDLEILSRCDAIFMLPNWEYSKGATAELQFAKVMDANPGGRITSDHNIYTGKPIKILKSLEEAQAWKDEPEKK